MKSLLTTLGERFEKMASAVNLESSELSQNKYAASFLIHRKGEGVVPVLLLSLTLHVSSSSKNVNRLTIATHPDMKGANSFSFFFNTGEKMDGFFDQLKHFLDKSVETLPDLSPEAQAIIGGGK